MIIPFFWGLFEATFFPLAPDVILSYLTLYGLKNGLIGCLFVLAGALLGGSLMYILGKKNPPLALKLVTIFPAVFPNMIYYVQTSLKQRGLIALFIGSLIGVPYKVYAMESGRSLQISLPYFLFVSIPSRMIRFVAVVLLLHLLTSTLLKNFPYKIELVTLFWITLYTLYFLKMSKWKHKPPLKTG